MGTFLAITIVCVSIMISFNSAFIYLQSKNARRNMKRNVTLDSNVIGTNPIPISRLSSLNIDDLSILEDYLYSIFLEFENALNSLDYNTMSRLTTPKLYNLYHTDISLNTRYGRKKIIKDIELKRILVYDVYSSDERQMIYAVIDVEYVSYTISKEGKIISGTTLPVKESFDITFTKKYSSEDIIKCPNCGNTVLGNTCNYCRTELRNQNFRMESIKRIVKKKI